MCVCICISLWAQTHTQKNEYNWGGGGLDAVVGVANSRCLREGLWSIGTYCLSMYTGSQNGCRCSFYTHVHTSCMTKAVGVGVVTHTDLGLQCIPMESWG